MSLDKKTIPLLKPKIFKEELIENKRDGILNNERIEDFFIHSFKDDFIQLKLPLPPHKKTVNDFVFILNGEMTRTIGLKTFALKPNEFLFTPKNNITTTENVDEDLEGFYGHFSNNFLADKLSLKFWSTQATSRNRVFLTDDQVVNLKLLLDRILELYREAPDKSSNYELIRYYLSTFLAEISVLMQEKISKNHVHSIVDTFNQLVNENFRKSREVSFYANRIHVSPNHLNKVIKTETGKSASEVINQICILEAKVLLIQTALDIHEIAYELGFNDPSYFSRFFKNQTDVSPTNYREMIDLS